MVKDVLINFQEHNYQVNFVCRQCARCCKNSRIKLSPYDILQICQNLKITSMEFHQKYSSFVLDSENHDFPTCLLKTSPECVFLDGKKCLIYDFRPLGCRTFPLGQECFYDGKEFRLDYYVLERCKGFETYDKNDADTKNTFGEFKANQKIYPEEIISLWAKFRTASINVKLPESDEFRQKFMIVCYDFDNPLFQDFLRKNSIVWPAEIEEQYKIVMEFAYKLLLDGYPLRE